MQKDKKVKKTVDYAPRDGWRGFLWSAMFAERGRRQILQIAQDKKFLPFEVHITFSSTHV